MDKLLTIIIPVYNEDVNIERVIIEIGKQDLGLPYEILFVNDGSIDNTKDTLQQLSKKYPEVNYLNFVKNFGHQIALKAGLDYANGDVTICMDGDMQHPPHLLPTLLNKWREGSDIVVTKRLDHQSIGYFKKLSSRLFYYIINKLSNIPISYGEADFRLMDKKVVAVFRKINEPDLFLRGLTRWVGFQVAEVTFTAEERFAGQSKYTFSKMFSLAINGILSFSTKPLLASIYIGLGCALSSIIVFIYALVSYLSGNVIPGWTSTLIIITFFSGIQLLVLGVISLYLAKLFMQVKNRPLYIVGETNYTNE